MSGLASGSRKRVNRLARANRPLRRWVASIEVQHELISEPGPLSALAIGQPARPRMALMMLVIAVLMSTGLCAAAILARAPAAAVPVIAAVCVWCPMLAGWEAPRALAALRADRTARRALANFRHGLDSLPETQHPLGL